MRIALLPAFNFCEFNLHAIFFVANIISTILVCLNGEN